ncbi:hypothetical protein ESCO_004790 [Escovopsis weberi]|uniref:Uncharacterized protein n=1 Tax=Escovopsis weberi TaxID=150374 RepID=A0A0M8MU30_ESCWE|nr:hypothetical protein ESCO_004790 [Escovopsis weberi]
MNASDCPGSIGFGNDENTNHSHHNPDSDLSHPSQPVSTPPSHEQQQQQQHPIYHSNHLSQSQSQSQAQAQAHSQSQSKASGIPCTCLSSLYFALNSLVQLPTHIPSAIRTARHASRMAYQVINCPECYDVTIVDPSKQPPIQCFQNLMCLGSLVPAACNAYVSILKMVDAETDLAKAEKRKLWFSLDELGGSWIAALLPCHADFLHKCNDKFIPPDVWRTAIRRILRLDVHGAEGGAFAASSMATPQSQSSTLSPCSPSDAGAAGEVEAQQPLKGVITLLDEKNRRRHAQIDRLITTGRMPENSPYLSFPGGHKVVAPEARNCSHVLETARLALSSLSIA